MEKYVCKIKLKNGLEAACASTFVGINSRTLRHDFVEKDTSYNFSKTFVFKQYSFVDEGYPLEGSSFTIKYLIIDNIIKNVIIFIHNI